MSVVWHVVGVVVLGFVVCELVYVPLASWLHKKRQERAEINVRAVKLVGFLRALAICKHEESWQLGNDDEWCPECGARRNQHHLLDTDGEYAWSEWQQPATVLALIEEWKGPAR